MPIQNDVRRKSQKLDNLEIKSIIEDLNASKLSIADISRKHSCSKSTIYNIQKQKDYYLHGRSKRHICKVSNIEVDNIVNSIYHYLNTNSLPWFIKDFQRLIEEKYSKTYSKHTNGKIMIKDARLTYKKISSRPISYSHSIINEARTLFSINFAKRLSPNTLILNIDEWTIGRECIIDYSWSHIGINKEWQNTFVSGSLKIILAIASNGWWYSLITQSNVNDK